MSNSHPTGGFLDSETLEYEISSPVVAQDGTGPPTFQFIPSTPDPLRTTFSIPPPPSSAPPSTSHTTSTHAHHDTENYRRSPSMIQTSRPQSLSFNHDLRHLQGQGHSTVDAVEIPTLPFRNGNDRNSVDSHPHGNEDQEDRYDHDQEHSHLQPGQYIARDMYSKGSVSFLNSQGEGLNGGSGVGHGAGPSPREGHALEGALETSQRALTALAIGVSPP